VIVLKRTRECYPIGNEHVVSREEVVLKRGDENYFSIFMSATRGDVSCSNYVVRGTCEESGLSYPKKSKTSAIRVHVDQADSSTGR
jgi:hypothetical protein